MTSRPTCSWGILWEVLVQHGIVHLRFGGHRFDQGDLLRADIIKDGLYFGGFHTRLVIIEQWVIGMVIRLEQFGVTFGPIDDLFQVRFKHAKV